MNITVLQEDIDGATPRQAWQCAVARAFQRVTGDSSYSVGETIGPMDDMDKFTATAPIIEYVAAVDRDETVYPITFLNIPEKNRS
jgi:hypothetical protein